MLSLAVQEKPWSPRRMVDTRDQDRLDRQRAGAALRALRKRAGMTQEAAADAAGVSVQSWRNYERGERFMDKGILTKATAALGSNPEEHAMEAARLSPARQPTATGSLVDDGRGFSIPVGGIAFGGSSRPNIYDEPGGGEVIDLRRFFPEGTRALRIAGMSMFPYAEPGELVLYNVYRPAKRGQGCVIEMKDGSYAVKRFERMDDSQLFVTELYPEERELTFELASIKGVYAIGLRGD